jgi:hypothetical protein
LISSLCKNIEKLMIHDSGFGVQIGEIDSLLNCTKLQSFSFLSRGYIHNLKNRMIPDVLKAFTLPSSHFPFLKHVNIRNKY